MKGYIDLYVLYFYLGSFNTDFWINRDVELLPLRSAVPGLADQWKTILEFFILYYFFIKIIFQAVYCCFKHKSINRKRYDLIIRVY
jgi:hypothetical protein